MPRPSDSQSHSHAEGIARSKSEDFIRDDDHTSTSVRAELLLTALRNVIIPIVRTAMPTWRDPDDVPSVLGPEAEDLLKVLQKYITCIIREHSSLDRREEIAPTADFGDTCSVVNSTNEKALKLNRSINVHDMTVSDISSPKVIYFTKAKSLPSKNQVNRADTELQHPNSNLLNDALTALRMRVFNEMPMRLLAFENRDSKLDITLLDRTEIYSLLESKLRDKARSQPLEATTAVTWVPDIATYAILSHTWLRSAPGEITFSDWQQGVVDQTQPGYQKLINFCKVAKAEHGLALGWMDTVCINKDSSAELDESIRSMYKWYQNAAVCIAYLAETNSLSDMAMDPWFTRGWTLQELLAPFVVRFYGTRWRPLRRTSTNDKLDPDIQNQIELATAITPIELMSTFLAPVSRRMQWAAKRQVTRAEDAAYSLMGIFNVSMSIAYGEGAELAFVRLVKEILSTAKHKVLDVFNWGGGYGINNSALLPSSPNAYLQRCELSLRRTALMEPLTVTHLGLRIPILLLPAAPVDSLVTPYSLYALVGNYYASVTIDPISSERDVPSGAYNILHAEAFGSSAARFNHNGAHGSVAFGVLNCGGDETDVRIPIKCFAIAILHNENLGKATPLGNNPRIPTKNPIVFSLNNKHGNPRYPLEYHTVQRSQIARHGMQLLTMYV